MELKVGDYVRTNYRREKIIRQVKAINVCRDGDHIIIFDKPGKYDYYVEDVNVYTFDDNVINLIQVGDYVNGMKVIGLDSDNRIYVPIDLGEPYIRNFDNGCFEYTLINLNTFDIKSIVTKEQFESMEYRIGDDK